METLIRAQRELWTDMIAIHMAERKPFGLFVAQAAWQLRDMRKTSLNDAGTLEEARRRAKHTDPRTTARHYEVRIDAVPGNLPKRNEG